VGIPFPGSVGAEGGRRWGLHGDVVLGGGNGVGGGVPRRGERKASSVWGGAERGGAGTRGGEAKWGEEGCRGELGRGGVKGGALAWAAACRVVVVAECWHSSMAQ